jgi:hypothetical protein
MITPEPSEKSGPLVATTWTTAFATAAATLANMDSGDWRAGRFDNVTVGLVNDSAISAVFRPITPPVKPSSNATIAMMANDIRETSRPNSTSRTRSLPAFGPTEAWSGSAVGGVQPRTAMAIGSGRRSFTSSSFGCSTPHTPYCHHKRSARSRS